jgi:hypothetical protein
MKGGIELTLVLSFSMMLLMASISVVGVMVGYNNARLMQEQIVALIEYHNKYDQEVMINIQQVTSCEKCSYIVDADPMERYHVQVFFPITVMFANFQSVGHVSGYTIPIS